MPNILKDDQSDHGMGGRGDKNYRSAPTVGSNKQTDDAQKNENRSAPTLNLAHEKREERMHVRFDVPFKLIVAGTSLTGRDISIGGVSTKRAPKDLETGKSHKAEMAIRFSGFRAQIPVGVKLKGVEQDGEARFEFTHIAPTELNILRRILKAQLSGRHLTIDQMAADEDPQTVRSRVQKDRRALPKPTPSIVRFGVAGVALFALVLGLGAALYEELFIIKPSFAAVTAPKVDIRAPNDGKLAAHDLDAGDTVSRDQQLVQVVDPDIKAQLDLTKATLSYSERLIENLKKGIDQGNDKVSIVSEAGGQAQAPVIKDLSSLEAQARLEEFQSSLEFKRAKIDALSTKMASGIIYAPCDCLVTWIRSEDGGYFVQKGEPLAELVVRQTEEVNVEALVHLDKIDRIEPNQRVQVVLPTTDESLPARVEAIQLESERVQRAGFPKWARQDMSHGSVVLSVEEKLSAEMVGLPVDVRFIEADRDGVRMAAELFNWVGDQAKELTSEASMLWQSEVEGVKTAETK